MSFPRYNFLIITLPVNILLEDEALLKFGKVTLEIMHTLGHTPGSISLVGEKLVFTGDILFAGELAERIYREVLTVICGFR